MDVTKEAQFIHHQMDDDSDRLAEALQGDYPEVVHMLSNAESEANPIRRLAAGLTLLLGSNATQSSDGDGGLDAADRTAERTGA